MIRSAIALMLLMLAGCTAVVTTISDGPIEPDPTETSIGTGLEDFKMATYIGVNINKADAILADAHVVVNVFDAVVLLVGEVPSEKMKRLAGEIARNFNGVRLVHNELQVAANCSIVSRANDSIITSHVKSKLMFTKNLDATDIEVVTENSVVYLMGKVTKNTGARAVDIASKTRGVSKVVRAFEVVD